MHFMNNSTKSIIERLEIWTNSYITSNPNFWYNSSARLLFASTCT